MGMKNHDHLLYSTTFSPYSSSDTLLTGPLQISEPSRKIVSILEEVSDNESVVVFWPKHIQNASIMYQMLSYLGWPRTILSKDVEADQIQNLSATMDRNRVAVLFFFGLPVPPDFSHVEQFSPFGSAVILHRKSK